MPKRSGGDTENHMLRDDETHTKLKNTTAEILVRSEAAKAPRLGVKDLRPPVGKDEKQVRIWPWIWMGNDQFRIQSDANQTGPTRAASSLVSSPPAAVPSGKVEFHLGSISGNPGPRAEDRGSGARAPTARCHPPQAAPVWPNKGPVVVWALSLGRLNGHKLHWTIGGSQGLVLGRPVGFHEPTLAIDSPEERSAKLYYGKAHAMGGSSKFQIIVAYFSCSQFLM
ncbi:LOW QUALITY PROTEIN: hypothetical protein N5P37_005411 [Trichoderma harzianum]|nr:LOW QUALITY PROTEIN: hypothetical protein N5P37_005411 [Trichoderma harzianum]